jgi:hypothetical protein
MDCRIGYPNEHVVKAKNENLLIPAMSTGVGLVIYGLEKFSPIAGVSNTETQTTAAGDKKQKPTLGDKARETKDSVGFLSRIKEFFDADEE